jgi:hypothetical protein
MGAHQVLLLIAILCELCACGLTFYPEGNPRSISAVALGLVFFFISLLVA